MKDKRKIAVTFDQQTSEIIRQMSENLETTPDQVISQALALFRRAQGNTVILRDEKHDKDWSTRLYSDVPARKG